MSANFVVTVLASVAVGATASAIIVSTMQKDKQSKQTVATTVDVRTSKQDQDKELVAKNSEISRLKNELSKFKAVEAEKSVPRVEVKRDAKTILGELPALYGSNDRLHQRRRIYLMETLVDLGEPGLADIKAFLDEAKDAEPDWRTDQRQQLADRFGLEAAQVEKLQPLLTESATKFFGMFRDGSFRDLSETERREKMTAMAAESQEAIKKLLTPQQLEKFSGENGIRTLMEGLRGGGGGGGGGFGGFGGFGAGGAGGENPGGGSGRTRDRSPRSGGTKGGN